MSYVLVEEDSGNTEKYKEEGKHLTSNLTIWRKIFWVCINYVVGFPVFLSSSARFCHRVFWTFVIRCILIVDHCISLMHCLLIIKWLSLCMVIFLVLKSTYSYKYSASSFFSLSWLVFLWSFFIVLLLTCAHKFQVDLSQMTYTWIFYFYPTWQSPLYNWNVKWFILNIWIWFGLHLLFCCVLFDTYIHFFNNFFIVSHHIVYH